MRCEFEKVNNRYMKKFKLFLKDRNTDIVLDEKIICRETGKEVAELCCSYNANTDRDTAIEWEEL